MTILMSMDKFQENIYQTSNIIPYMPLEIYTIPTRVNHIVDTGPRVTHTMSGKYGVQKPPGDK